MNRLNMDLCDRFRLWVLAFCLVFSYYSLPFCKSGVVLRIVVLKMFNILKERIDEMYQVNLICLQFGLERGKEREVV